MILLFIDYPDFLTYRDLIVAPVFLFLLFLLTKKQAGKYKETEVQKFYLPAFGVRMLACILAALKYQYYYDYGDHFGYYHGAIAFKDLLFQDPVLYLKAFFQITLEPADEAYSYFIESQTTRFVIDNSTFLMLKIGSVLALIGFNSFMAMGFVLSYFSFLACWKIFEIFNEEYPKILWSVALSTLFIPSVIFWGGAGLFKDTVSISLLGYAVWSAYQYFIKKRRNFWYLVFLAFTISLLFINKVYIGIVLLPSLILWVLLSKFSEIWGKSKLRIIVPISFVLLALGTYGFIEVASSVLDDRYAPESLIELTKGQRNFVMSKVNENFSGYDLGDYEASVFGVLKKVPSAINVTLFRPYAWEIHKWIMIPNVIEALITLLFTLYVLFKTRIVNAFSIAFSEPNVLFCLVFSLIFSFGVGFIAYNFGTLARFKFICLPFYFLGLSIILHLNNEEIKPFKETRNYT